MIYNRKTSQPESPWGSLVTLLLSIKITGKMLKHCYFNGHRDKTPDILAEAFGKEAPDAIRTGWGWHKPEPWTLSGCDGFWALTAVPGGLCQICDFSAPTQLPAQRWSFSPCRLCLASPAAQKQLSEDTSVLCPCSLGLGSRHSLPPPSSSLGSARRCSARAPRQSAQSPLSWSLLRKQRFTIIC